MRSATSTRGTGEPSEMLSNIGRDVARVPAPARRRHAEYFDEVAATLLRGRLERGRPRTRAAAGIGHAVSFPTWRSLVREQGLDETDAVELMVRMVAAARG